MVDGALRLPRRVGRHSLGRGLQGKRFTQFHNVGRIHLGIEVSQHDQVPAAVQFTGQKFQLLRPCPLTQGKVHNGDIQPVKPATETHQQGSATGNNTRQTVFFHRIRLVAAQKTVTGIGQCSDLAVGLVTPERHTCMIGEIA